MSVSKYKTDSPDKRPSEIKGKVVLVDASLLMPCTSWCAHVLNFWLGTMHKKSELEILVYMRIFFRGSKHVEGKTFDQCRAEDT